MSVTGRRARFLLVAALALGPLRHACAYSGIGRAALERALTILPQTEDELARRIEELERQVSSGDVTAKTSYALAVALLNRPRSYTLGEVRDRLADAIASDPAHEDALELWLDLVPPDDALEALAARLAGTARPAAREGAWQWALARIWQRLGKADEAERALVEAMNHDPGLRGRVAWLRSVMAGERKDEEAATRHFLEAAGAGDDATFDLLWRTAVWLASPDELEAWKTGLSQDRGSYFLSFWKKRDVFPLTDANERLGEHYRRLARARDLYALRSNGFAYFTSHDAFKEQSPDLPYWSSDVVYDYQARMPTWLDHRGLVYIRHGEPDRATRSSDHARAETWLYFRWSFKPLLFHFVVRRGVGEFVLSLNLAQAAATASVEDDPTQILFNSADFRDLYTSRSSFGLLFQRIAVERSRIGLEELLVQEAQMMAGYLREAWYDDTNGLLKKDDILPFAALSANFRGSGDRVDAYVYYAIPEKEIKTDVPAYEFDATLVLFSRNWSAKLTTAEHHLRWERKPGKRPGKKDLLVGGLELKDLEPGRYNYAFQVTERSSGKIGIARGQFIVDYFGPGWVNLSELLLAERVEPTDRDSVFERNGQRVVPIPNRVVSRSKPVELYYEIYDLKPGADGKQHYRVETRVLQIQQETTVADRLFGLGMDIASLFFPYQIFLAQAGLFGLQVASNDPDRGLDLKVEERTVATDAPVVSESARIDTRKYPNGVYQAYVTVKDYVSGSVTTRSLRFAIKD